MERITWKERNVDSLMDAANAEWHVHHTIKPLEVAEKLGVNVDVIREILLGSDLISSMEWAEREAYAPKQLIVSPKQLCERCGLVIFYVVPFGFNSFYHQNYNGRCGLCAEIEPINKPTEISDLSWEELMVEAGWNEGMFGVWYHNTTGKQFSEADKIEPMFQSKTLGEYFRQHKIVPT